eukprot:UN03295
MSPIPIFAKTILSNELPLQFELQLQHFKDQEFCVLIHQYPDQQQTDGAVTSKPWYVPAQSIPSSHNNKNDKNHNNTAGGPPIPYNKHVNIKIYGTYDNIKQLNYNQLRHTLHYEYDQVDEDDV